MFIVNFQQINDLIDKSTNSLGSITSFRYR